MGDTILSNASIGPTNQRVCPRVTDEPFLISVDTRGNYVLNGTAGVAADSFDYDCDHDKEATMKRIASVFLVTFALGVAARAQAPDPDPALNNPDKVSWELFTMANKSVPGANNNVVFETWASNEDTFQPNPKFPGSAAPPNCAPAQVAMLTTALPQQPPVTPGRKSEDSERAGADRAGTAAARTAASRFAGASWIRSRRRDAAQQGDV